MPTVPTDIADTPTIGAWRRAHNTTQWSDEAQHLFAVTIADEALRRLLIERLDQIQHFLDSGATPHHPVNRLADNLATWHQP